MSQTCSCTSEAQHHEHMMAELHEAITKTELSKLTDRELDGIIKKYLLRVPKGLHATRSVKIRHITRNARNFGNVYPFDAYKKTPKGIRQRITSLAQNLNYRLVNNAVRIIGKANNVQYFIWITRPDLSRTGPCLICAPRHLKQYRPHQFMPRMPAHPGCVCQWQVEYE